MIVFGIATMMDPNNNPESPDQDQLDAEDAQKRAILVRFVSEMLILLTGVCLGFFWSHYAEGISNEANIIMMLALIIIGLLRYIHLTRK